MAEPLLPDRQPPPQASNCTGAAVPAGPSPGAEERAPGEDSRWQARAAPLPGGPPGPEGDGSRGPAGPPLQNQPCLEAGERSQNGERGPSPAAAAGEPSPEAQPLAPPCHGSDANKLGAPAAGGEAWGQQLRQLGKKKHRRRPSKKKRHWKPYYKLTWEEKKKFDEKQSLRASRIRAEMFAKGQPVAPYNTTQFLMDDHDQEEPDLKTGLYPRRAAAKSDDTSDEDFMEEAGEEDGGSDGMGGDGSEFLQRDFSETYERYHAESLQNMSKQELIKEYLELEKCLSRMEDENNRLRLESKRPAGEDARVRELEQELERLRAENLRLRAETPRLPPETPRLPPETPRLPPETPQLPRPQEPQERAPPAQFGD